MGNQELNGPNYVCPVGNDWAETKAELKDHIETIAKNLGDIAKAVNSSNDNLIGPATGKRQVPLDVVLPLIIFWGVYSVIIQIKDTHKTVKINWTDGLLIEDKDTK